MEQKQVSIDGLSYALPKLFMVIATQNPLFHADTNAFPESQVDSVLMRLVLGFSELQTEKLILQQDCLPCHHTQQRPCLEPPKPLLCYLSVILPQQ